MERKYRTWTTEELRAEARKYNARGEFAIKSGSAYQTAYNRGLLDEICGHMKPKRAIWTDEALASLAAEYESLRAFRKEQNRAYQSAYARGILDDIASHMVRLKKKAA